MITINNTQDSITIDEQKLESDAQRILDMVGYPDFDLGILITDNTTIQEYNSTYRDKDKPTDILSFAFYPELEPGEKIEADSPDEKNLGDLIISAEYVQEDAPNWDHTFIERMRVLLVHGVCHLLGYDHEDDEDYKQMKTEEDRILAALKEK